MLHDLRKSPAYRQDLDDRALFRELHQADWSRFTEEELEERYWRLAEALGIADLVDPLDIITFPDGRKGPYIPSRSSFALAAKRQLSIRYEKQEMTDRELTVWMTCIGPGGRSVTRSGTVALRGRSGQDRCNGMMHAETKAGRRAILAYCGLGFLDESEARDIEGARLAMDSLPGTGDAVLEGLGVLSAPQIEWYRKARTRYEWSDAEERVLLERYGITRIEALGSAEAFREIARDIQSVAVRDEIRALTAPNPETL